MKDHYDHKLEFFIGSTKHDLSAVREKLIIAVLEAKQVPSGMELWASGSEPLLTDIADHLQQCDAHIIIVGARYGAIIEGEEISYTEWEFNQSNGKRPILAFLLEDVEFKKERKKVIKEDPSEGDKEEALINFRKVLTKNRFCRDFSNTTAGIEKLGRLCTNSINELINTKRIGENAGWMKTSSNEASILREIRGNKFLGRELERLREFSTSGERVNYDKVSKEKQAEIFWETMKGRIRRHGFMNLFFESGSTLAYVSDQFENLVLKNGGKVESWRIWTNNVLTLFQLLLYTDVDIKRFPECAPDPKEKDGAIFPSEWSKNEETFPLSPRGLFPEETQAVNKLRDALLKFSDKTLLLATSSGWDFENEVRDFRGPHVGSHPNMLFKRALFTSGQPVVIFLTAEKLGDPFESGKCFPIFGPDKPLSQALKEFPLAICVGFDADIKSPTRRKLDLDIRKERNNPNTINNMLKDINLNVIYTSPKSEETGAIIAGNTNFEKLLPND